MSDDKPADAKSEKPESVYNLKSPVDVARLNIKEGYATMLCCCVLVCENKQTQGSKCCCCFPIICGVNFIAFSIVLITIVQFLEIFYQLLNDSIDWWYVLVGVGISIPLIIGFGLAVYWFAEDTDGTRVGLQSAGILLIISVALLATWNTLYFTLLYEDKNVIGGNNGIGFVTTTVKQQVVFSLWIAAIVCAFFSYYLCILGEYKNLYREADVKQWLEENPESDDEADAKKEEEKKDEGAAE
jgi:hypothetical protein